MNRNTAQKNEHSKRQVPRALERMMIAYVDVVLFGGPESLKVAALEGLRLIVEQTRKGAPR
jgi:hypothetical protein